MQCSISTVYYISQKEIGNKSTSGSKHKSKHLMTTKIKLQNARMLTTFVFTSEVAFIRVHIPDVYGWTHIPKFDIGFQLYIEFCPNCSTIYLQQKSRLTF